VVVTAKDLSDEERRELNGQVTQVVAKQSYDRDTLLEEVRRLVLESIDYLDTDTPGTDGVSN
jgi:hypothetical protein